jgi:hypothetical protein
MTQDSKDWRFIGNNSHRWENNPEEEGAVAIWKEFLGTRPDEILAQILGLRDQSAVEERDWYTATSLIQWLMSPVGKAFLEKMGCRPHSSP